MLKFKYALTAISLAILGSSTLAGGGGGIAGGGATEWTQISNHDELVKTAANTAQTAVGVIQQYQVQLEQLRNIQLNTQGVDAQITAANLLDITTSQQTLQTYRNALTQLEGDLVDEGKTIDQRLAEAKLLSLNWDDYVKRVNQEAATESSRQKARLAYEKALLERVNQDYEWARQQATLIPQTVGAHQAIQLLNTQMNRVVTQNAQLIEILAKAGTGASGGAGGAATANAKAIDSNVLNNYFQRQKEMQIRQDKGLTIDPTGGSK